MVQHYKQHCKGAEEDGEGVELRVGYHVCSFFVRGWRGGVRWRRLEARAGLRLREGDLGGSGGFVEDWRIVKVVYSFNWCQEMVAVSKEACVASKE